MPSLDLIVKAGDTQPWVLVASDTTSGTIVLSDARVTFRMRRHEWHTDDLFVRDSGGTGSDYISLAAGGAVTITPTAADWADLSDATGVFVGEFRVSDSSGYGYSKDVVVRVDEAMF